MFILLFFTIIENIRISGKSGATENEIKSTSVCDVGLHFERNVIISLRQSFLVSWLKLITNNIPKKERHINEKVAILHRYVSRSRERYISIRNNFLSHITTKRKTKATFSFIKCTQSYRSLPLCKYIFNCFLWG